MKNILSICLFLCLGFNLTTLAQSIDMQFVESSNSDCDNNTACFIIQVSSSDGADFIGNSSIRFSYDSNVILFDGYHATGINNGSYTELGFFNDGSCSNAAFYDSEHAFDGSVLGDFLITTVLYESTFGFPCTNLSDGAWYDVSEICFDVLDSTGDPNLTFVGIENGFPITNNLSETNFNDGTNDPTNKYNNGSFGNYSNPLTALCPIDGWTGGCTGHLYTTCLTDSVGIGTANPTEKLEVKGNIKVDGNKIILGKDAGFEFFRSNAGSSQFLHYGTAQYSFRAIDYAAISFWTNSLARMQVTKDGDLKLFSGEAYKVGTATWAPLSDRRLKQNIQTYKGGLDELMQINPVTFEYNEKVTDNSKEYVGIIAQEVKEVAPYMIRDITLTDKNGEEIEGEDYLAVNPNAFIYMLINSTKEQQNTIESQQATIEKLQQEMEMIKEVLGIKATDTHNDSPIKRDGNSINGDNGDILQRASLGQNAPNPANQFTTIEYFVPHISQNALHNSSNATINIYDLQGKLIKSIEIAEFGNGNIQFNTQSLTAGMYHYSLIVDGKIMDTKQMVIE